MSGATCVERMADGCCGLEDVVLRASDFDENADTVVNWTDALPDELLENIFGRLSPYHDLDNVKSVCQRWNRVAGHVIGRLKIGFEKSFITGSLRCETFVPSVGDKKSVMSPWISARFGHMCCYYDQAMYVIGGTAQASTTFNDMWKFDLHNRSWSRCIASGNYPTPKALASCVQYKDNFVVFGGWAHPPPYPLMQPWRIFDELHIFNVPTMKWKQVFATRSSPFPTAGHSASVHGDIMIVFGGRIFNKQEQSYPISNSAWVFNFDTEEWYEVTAASLPPPRYGQTQVALNDSHALILGGCGGPNQIFADAWLLKVEPKGNRYIGKWKQMTSINSSQQVPGHDFHYSGCKVGSKVVFCERSSRSSPFLAFLHFDNCNPVTNYNLVPNAPDNVVFEQGRQNAHFHSTCSSGLRLQSSSVMSIYSVDVSKVLTEGTVEWRKEPEVKCVERPKERLLYSMIAGRAELVIFGGFYKEPNGRSCRVSSDVFVLRTEHKTY